MSVVGKNRLQWPDQNSGWNPIENLWGYMKRILRNQKKTPQKMNRFIS